MTRTELIQEIEKLSEQELEEVRATVQKLAVKRNGPTLMEKLRAISIDAPEDFSVNHERYASGELKFDTDVR